jgi:nucleoside-diphosphate-sugar epimerase
VNLIFKKVLITGSSGFIGQELCNFFLKKDHKVFGLDKSRPKHLSRITFFKCDIMNKEHLLKVLREINPELIIHLAARADLKSSNLNYYKENFIGTKNIIDSANLVPVIKRVIFTSTLLVNKIGTNIDGKFTFYNPNTKYCESKALMEKIIRFSSCKFEWCIVRPTTIWGDNIQNHFKSLLNLIQKKIYFHIGHKKIFKSYGYIKNSVFQIYKLAYAKKNLFNNKIYYISDYENIELREWTNKISGLLTGKDVMITLPVFLAKFIAKIGDFLLIFGFEKFPIQSYRLNNILVNFKVDTKTIKKICGKLPYNSDEAILSFVNSYKLKKFINS